jgi:hypothetical protein
MERREMAQTGMNTRCIRQFFSRRDRGLLCGRESIRLGLSVESRLLLNLLLGKPPALQEDSQRLTVPRVNKKPRRVCAKLKETMSALKARCSKAQGASPGTGWRIGEAL